MRDFLPHQQVFGILVIEIDSCIQTIPKHSQVNTQVKLFRRLPLQICISQLIIGIPRLTVIAYLIITIERTKIRNTILITGSTITGTNLQLVNLIELLHEFLISQVPGSSNRPENSSFIASYKFRRLIITQTCGQVISIVKSIIPLGKRRKKIAVSLASTYCRRIGGRTVFITNTGRCICHKLIQIISCLIKSGVNSIK